MDIMRENGTFDDLLSRLQCHGVLSKKSNTQQSNKWTKRFCLHSKITYFVVVQISQ